MESVTSRQVIVCAMQVMAPQMDLGNKEDSAIVAIRSLINGYSTSLSSLASLYTDTSLFSYISICILEADIRLDSDKSTDNR